MKVVLTLSLDIDEEVLEQHDIDKKEYVESLKAGACNSFIIVHSDMPPLRDNFGNTEKVFHKADVVTSIITRKRVHSDGARIRAKEERLKDDSAQNQFTDAGF